LGIQSNGGLTIGVGAVCVDWESATMKVGDLVKVETKHYGVGLGVLVKELKLRDIHWHIKMFNQPRDIYAQLCDLEVISASR